jgi:hypothetical protein
VLQAGASLHLHVAVLTTCRPVFGYWLGIANDCWTMVYSVRSTLYFCMAMALPITSHWPPSLAFMLHTNWMDFQGSEDYSVQSSLFAVGGPAAGCSALLGLRPALFFSFFFLSFSPLLFSAPRFPIARWLLVNTLLCTGLLALLINSPIAILQRCAS